MILTPVVKKLTKLLLSLVLVSILCIIAYRLYPVLFPPSLTLAPEEAVKAAYIIPDGPFRIGDLIPVTLEVESRHGINYQMPELPAGRLGPLEISDQQRNTTARRRGGLRQTAEYTLTAWEVGNLLLPPVTLYYQDLEGAEQTYELIPVEIVVASLLPTDKTRKKLGALPLKGVKDPVGLPPNWSYLGWFLLILAGAFLLWLIIHLIRGRVAHKASFPEEGSPPEAADQIAQRRLVALKKAAYLEGGDFKGFYSELSEILREYMENRFQITALEMTTEEFLAHLAAPDQISTSASIQQTALILNREQQTKLTAFLTTADLVKFAQHLPATSQIEADLKIVEQLIAETKKEPAVPVEIGGHGHPDEILIDQEQLL